MKTLLFAFAFLLAGKAFSQVNVYFDNNPVWAISTVDQYGAPCIHYEASNYFVNGDTLIDALV